MYFPDLVPTLKSADIEAVKKIRTILGLTVAGMSNSNLRSGTVDYATRKGRAATEVPNEVLVTLGINEAPPIPAQTPARRGRPPKAEQPTATQTPVVTTPSRRRGGRPSEADQLREENGRLTTELAEAQSMIADLRQQLSAIDDDMLEREANARRRVAFLEDAEFIHRAIGMEPAERLRFIQAKLINSIAEDSVTAALLFEPLLEDAMDQLTSRIHGQVGLLSRFTDLYLGKASEPEEISLNEYGETEPKPAENNEIKEKPANPPDFEFHPTYTFRGN